MKALEDELGGGPAADRELDVMRVEQGSFADRHSVAFVVLHIGNAAAVSDRTVE